MSATPKRIDSIAALDAVKSAYKKRMDSYKNVVLICGGSGCISSGCAEVLAAAEKSLRLHGLDSQTIV